MKKIIESAINSQIAAELNSAYIYLGMAAYAESQNLKGFANWFTVQFKEEMDHATGFINFMNERGAKVEFAALDKPATDYKNIKAAVEETLKHEKYITGRIHKLSELAIKQKDYALESFNRWYVDEQVEEESNAAELLEKTKLVADNSSALFMLDKELSARAYAPASILGTGE